ncbi:MAG TPA: hypothetical protein VEH27_08495 [Methylomirabilota bacterium]|nr:hypothetical protein [Methylomirabilota bacterium]
MKQRQQLASQGALLLRSAELFEGAQQAGGGFLELGRWGALVLRHSHQIVGGAGLANFKDELIGQGLKNCFGILNF